MVERKASPGLSPELNRLQPVMKQFIYLRVKKDRQNLLLRKGIKNQFELAFSVGFPSISI